ncbi:iron-sulfur cluster assembly scaffold protein [Candidatus Shapirobacteria bacterium]|nr:iron-sulfur cluster assembly scaffold protein [Candidatus Shapirobacteria bacterium]
MYNQQVLKAFHDIKNYGRIKNPDGVGKVGNIVCGDVMQLYLKMGKNAKGEEIIRDIKFETFGCVAAIATSVKITEMAKGKTLDEALKISQKEIVDSLGGLPPVKIHCSVLAADALSEAIYDYLKKAKKAIPAELEKRHQRTEKERQLVEEKYHDWTGKQFSS